MEIILPYGDGALRVDIGAGRSVRAAGDRSPRPLDDPAGELARALDRPVGSRPLADLVPSSGAVVVLVSDATRGGGIAEALLGVLRRLESCGAGPDRATVVVALGMHRGSAPGEIEAGVGAEVAGRWRVREHDARDAGSLVEVGSTPAGTRCYFDRAVVEAGLVVTVGAVSFHYFAGYGGARKLILPGAAGERTILSNHRLSLAADAGAGLAGGCRPGNLDGNPVHEDMLAGARLLESRLFAVNLVRGLAGETIFVNGGELDASHRAACAYLEEHFTIPLDRRFAAVIASAGGHPADINLLQGHKAVRNASEALEEGGVMLVAAECREGIGSDSYLDAFARGRHAVADGVRRRYTLNAQAAMSTLDLTARHSIYLRSSLEDGLSARFGFCAWKDDYTAFLLDGIPDEEILFLPHASRFLPRVSAKTGCSSDGAIV